MCLYHGMENITPHEALKSAFKAVGKQKDLAAILGITDSALSQWHQAPPAHVLAIEKASGVSRHLLRPDIFGAKPDREKV